MQALASYVSATAFRASGGSRAGEARSAWWQVVLSRRCIDLVFERQASDGIGAGWRTSASAAAARLWARPIGALKPVMRLRDQAGDNGDALRRPGRNSAEHIQIQRLRFAM
jgi:hypothetical protein